MIGEVMAFWAQLRDPACGMPIAPSIFVLRKGGWVGGW